MFGFEPAFRPIDAEHTWCNRALAGKEGEFGKDHPSTFETINSLAKVYQLQGQYHELLRSYQRSLAAKEIALGTKHLHTLNTGREIAAVYSSLGRNEESLQWSGRALSGYDEAFGKEHALELDIAINISMVCITQSRYDDMGEAAQAGP